MSFGGLLLGPPLTAQSAKVTAGSRNHVKSACNWSHDLGEKKRCEKREISPGEYKSLNKNMGIENYKTIQSSTANSAFLIQTESEGETWKS